MIYFIILNLVVFASSVLLQRRYFYSSNLIDRMIANSVIFLTHIALSEITLGIFNLLYLQNLILFSFLILLFVFFIIRRRQSKDKPKNHYQNDAYFLSNKTLLFCFSVIIGFSLTKIAINLVSPPFGWDNLNYHFTFPVEWLKHGNLEIPITIADDPSPSYYPINGSLFFLWLILPFKNVFLADLGQIPFFFLAFLAAYRTSQRVGLDQEYSFYAATLFFLIPNFFKQLEIAYVDVMVASLFLVCVNYLFLLEREFSLKNAVLYSMGLGLFLGIKTLALTYSALLFAPFLFLYFKNYKRTSLALPISILIIIGLGGFSYIRNFIDTGNPMYPLDFKVLGQTIFKGVMDFATYSAHFTKEDYRLSKLLFHEGLGIQACLFILPSLFLALPISWMKQKKMLSPLFLYFLLLPFLMYLVYRFIIPLANTRYLYALFALGSIISLYTVKSLNIPKHIVKILVIISVIGSMFEIARKLELIISVIAAVFIFFLFPFVTKTAKQWILKNRLLCDGVLGILLACMVIFLEKNYVKHEYPRYITMENYSGFWPDATRAWNWFNNNTSENNIAYAGRPVPFPLYGTYFKNNVYYISINKTEPAKLHYFLNSRYQWGGDFSDLHQSLSEKGNYRADADYSVWLRNLLQKNTDYLFIYSLHQTKEIAFPLEDTWARDHSDQFNLVFSNETIRIYKVIQ
ncbi:MAG: hypothetical protein HYY61_02755 [Deltaproteobacteria bacterium]|nr:hypothetical protein [Deltaproteobacteria bacterium]